ncbi:PTS sugar transporter subunit IIB [Cytobacillus praedii]|uniref:PTS galactitol transporter subunit IIB n=1 Tax=Cytobacillus praedii TaxID=1742358 RepID=A0A4V2NUP5_9BACI|nr:PTS sugar transporter subunit IIB [Cytobacillus praedii]MED3553478.1 PTS sugar transporter subunit IIB [Cytobacillus praedii]MED3572103.1 PTS sugar transporter subunit IIB [Cytobacillus praedii]TCJ05351.1 PTS galactitol transporter subunit IIB [Cytobacillus praedii]
MKKRIVVACGAGLATSTMILQKVEEFVKELGVSCSITQSQIYELDFYDGEADLFITSMKLDQSKYKTPIVVGTPFLIGLNEDVLKEQIKQILLN